MAIKKFKKEETNKKNVIKIVSAFMVIGIMLAGISYAVYQHEDEKLFINAKVGEFKENDIELAMKLDGEQIDIPPAKDNYIVTVECDYADGEWDSEKWGALVTNINANKVKCEVNFKTPGAMLSEITATSTKTEISLSYKAEGRGTSTTCKWGTEEGVYPNEVEATNTNCNIKELEMDTTYYYQVCAKNIGGKACKEGNIKTKPEGDPISIVNIGDYISMTPTSTSYTLPNELSGCTGETSTCVQNTINPSELNLWRVIRKNDDGTVDVVSEYVSSKTVYFYGKTGYINYIKGLNEIAAQYTNEKYVARTRHIGYNNQTEVITDTNKLSYINSRVPWEGKSTCDRTEMRYGCDKSKYLCGVDEELGAGDFGLETDYWLVYGYYKSMLGKTPDGTKKGYFVSSRFYSSLNYRIGWFKVRIVNEMDVVDSVYLYSLDNDKEVSEAPEASIRPILTLKADIEILFGDGKSASTPYQLN